MNAMIRRATSIALALALGAAAGTTLAQGGPGHGPGMMGGGMMGGGMMGGGMMGDGMMGDGMMGDGMMGDRMMGGGHGAAFLESLHLSDEQRDKIQSIHEENRQKNWATMGQVQSEMFTLRRMLRAEKVDPNAVADQQKKVDELRRQMLVSRLEAHNQVEAALTPEQRKQLRQHRPWRMGGGE